MFLSVESCCIAMSLPVGVVFFYDESDSVDANKLESFEQVLYVYFAWSQHQVNTLTEFRHSKNTVRCVARRFYCLWK